MRNIIIILGLLCFSCNSIKQLKYSNGKIIGRWCSVSNAADYPHLTFRKDGYVIIDCKIDTVFGLKFSIQNNYLKFMPDNKPAINNKIKKFTNDSLVFETLLDHQAQQVYYRCNEK